MPAIAISSPKAAKEPRRIALKRRGATCRARICSNARIVSTGTVGFSQNLCTKIASDTPRILRRPDKQLHAGLIPLLERDENLRYDQALKPVWFHVAHDSHHLPLTVHIQKLTDRILLAEIAAREGLVEDYHFFGLCRILF